MAEKIALLCDSMCDLPSALTKELGIKMVAARVIYPNEEYADRIDIQPSEVYDRMPEEIPTTSMPPMQEIRDTLEAIRKEGFTHVLAVHISTGLSGTAQVVEMAAREFNDMIIEVIDSKTLSMGTGWIVLEAARQIASGLSYQKIIDNIKQLPSKVNVYYVIETLEYLRKGGRIGLVAGMLGDFLNLKPIISVNTEGKYYTYCKAKGRRKSIEKLFQIVEEAVQNRVINLAVVHGGAPKECESMLDRIHKLPNIKEIITTDISPVLGVHTGPGLVGVCIYEV